VDLFLSNYLFTGFLHDIKGIKQGQCKVANVTTSKRYTMRRGPGKNKQTSAFQVASKKWGIKLRVKKRGM